MNKNFLQFDTYWQAARHAVGVVNGRKTDLGVKHIFLVPKMHTLFFERELSSIGGGFFDIEVYSLNRLFYKLGGGGLLPKEGAVMVLRDILKDKALVCFERSKGFRGFCEKLYQTICSFCLSGIKPDDLAFTGALGLKLSDIKEVYKEFLSRTQNAYVDKAGMIKLIKQKLAENNFFKSAHVYAVNFALMSALERELFDYISSLALSYTETNVSGAPKITAETEIYSSPSNVDALKAAARRIRAAAESGTSYGDMCLVCAPQTNETAKRIFNEYKIPAYAETRVKLNTHALSQYLLTMLRLNKLNSSDIVSLSKNPFCGIERDKSDVFENYISCFNINYSALAAPFTLTDKKRDALKAQNELEIAEETRKKLCGDIFAFNAKLKKAKSAQSFCETVGELITLKAAAGDILQTEPALNKLKEVLSLIKNVYQGAEKELTDKETAFLAELLREGVESSFLGSLPLLDECVIIGESENFRGKRYKYTFILDFNEGVMPAVKTDMGALADGDLALLKEGGVKLSPDLSEQNGQNERELLQLMGASERLFLSYISLPDCRPSPMLYGITGAINSAAREKEDLALAGDKALAFYACCYGGGLEHFLLNKDNPTAFTASLKEVLGEKSQKFLHQDFCAINKNIFFGGKTVSATQLQTYFDCPYKHFVKYGLRAKEDEKGQISAIDIGFVIHLAAEMFFKSDFNKAKIEQIAEKALSEYGYKIDENPVFKQKLKDEIIKLCLIFASHVQAGQFKPLGAEINLHKNPKLKTVNFDGVELSGVIDYADEFNGFARIIDYKTGYAAFDAKTLYYGVKLQLPLYAAALKESNYKLAAFFYFPFKAKWTEDGYGFTGVFDKSPDIVLAQDPSLANLASAEETRKDSKILPAFIKKTKEGLKTGGKGAKSAEEIAAMCAYAKDVSLLAVKQIKQGFITPSPYRENRYNSCLYCGYASACNHNGSFRVLKAASFSEDKKDD